MAEIKTCEQYVLRELENTQRIVESLKDTIEILKDDNCDLCHQNDLLLDELNKYKTFIDEIKPMFSIGFNDTIKFDDEKVYPWYEERKVLYDKMIDMLGLEIPNRRD